MQPSSFVVVVVAAAAVAAAASGAASHRASLDALLAEGVLTTAEHAAALGRVGMRERMTRGRERTARGGAPCDRGMVFVPNGTAADCEPLLRPSQCHQRHAGALGTFLTSSDDLLVDVGLNSVWTFLESAPEGVHARVIGFEPGPAACAKSEGMARNPSYAPGWRVDVRCKAVSNATGTLDLLVAAKSTQRSTFSAAAAKGLGFAVFFFGVSRPLPIASVGLLASTRSHVRRRRPRASVCPSSRSMTSSRRRKGARSRSSRRTRRATSSRCSAAPRTSSRARASAGSSSSSRPISLRPRASSRATSSSTSPAFPSFPGPLRAPTDRRAGTSTTRAGSAASRRGATV